MRKNPYYKDIEDQMPLFMQGPNSIVALTQNKAQEDMVRKAEIPKISTYVVNGSSFNMIQAPLLFQNKDMRPSSIEGIEMGQTEVTQDLFNAVTGIDVVAPTINDSPDRPMVFLTWFDCIHFCNMLSEKLGFEPCYKINIIEENFGGWAFKRKDILSNILNAKVVWEQEGANGFRLPTDLEWVAFAKAGTQNTWSGCDYIGTVDKYAWFDDNYVREPSPVGLKLPNEWGIYDMSGNVSEWLWDLAFPNEGDEIPQGDDGLKVPAPRMLRGGSYFDSPEVACIECATYDSPSTYDRYVGLRLARTVRSKK